MEDYEIKISQLIDNELPKEEQEQLFLFLSQNDEARETFTDFIQMKKETKLFYNGILPELNEPNIIAPITNSKSKKYKMGFYFSAAASLLLAFLLAGNIVNKNSQETNYKNLETEFVTLQKDFGNVLSEKDELMDINKNLIYQKNNLELEYQKYLEQSKRIRTTTELNNEYKMGNEYLTVLAEIPTIKITKEDYLAQ